MLSILIPVYNFDIQQLVTDLHAQCEQSGVEFEILCFDDGSKEPFKIVNKRVGEMKKVIYREMPENLGRSGIRNTLGRAAQFPYLLFMDCDSKVVDEHYIQKYLDKVSPERLVYGGRVYSLQMPKNQEFIFHWKYGSEREVQSPQLRQVRPWHSFMTNNFLVPRSIFLEIQFDETLKQYGHEDTLFGLELARRKIPILHIDAPLEHIGLEAAEVFLSKTCQGLENLHQLWQDGKPVDTKLLRVFLKIKKLGLKGIFKLLFSLTKMSLEKNICGQTPSMRIFDFYKLGYLCSL